MEHRIQTVLVMASQEMWTIILVPQNAMSNTRGKLPTSYGRISGILDPRSEPCPCQHPLHCLSWHCQPTAVLSIPLGQAFLLPWPLRQHTPGLTLEASSLSQSPVWRSHALLQQAPLWRQLFTRSSLHIWGRTLFSCWTLTHHALCWGASTLLTDAKLKILFTEATQVSRFVPQKYT